MSELKASPFAGMVAANHTSNTAATHTTYHTSKPTEYSYTETTHISPLGVEPQSYSNLTGYTHFSNSATTHHSDNGVQRLPTQLSLISVDGNVSSTKETLAYSQHGNSSMGQSHVITATDTVSVNAPKASVLGMLHQTNGTRNYESVQHRAASSSHAHGEAASHHQAATTHTQQYGSSSHAHADAISHHQAATTHSQQYGSSTHGHMRAASHHQAATTHSQQYGSSTHGHMRAISQSGVSTHSQCQNGGRSSIISTIPVLAINGTSFATTQQTNVVTTPTVHTSTTTQSHQQSTAPTNMPEYDENGNKVIWGTRRVKRAANTGIVPRVISPDLTAYPKVNHQIIDRMSLHQSYTVGNVPSKPCKPTNKSDFQKRGSHSLVSSTTNKNSRRKEVSIQQPSVAEDFFHDPNVKVWSKDRHHVDYTSTTLVQTPFVEPGHRFQMIESVDGPTYHTVEKAHFSEGHSVQIHHQEVQHKQVDSVVAAPKKTRKGRFSKTSHSKPVTTSSSSSSSSTSISSSDGHGKRSRMKASYHSRKSGWGEDKDVMKAKASNKKLHLKQKIDHKRHSEVMNAFEGNVAFRPSENVEGILLLTIHKATDIKYKNRGIFDKEKNGKGPKGCLKGAARFATCDLCACGRVDACCGKADPFCTAEIEYPALDENDTVRIGRMMQTHTINNNHSPTWNHTYPCLIYIEKEYFKGSSASPSIKFKIYDDDFAADDLTSDAMCIASLDVLKVLATAGNAEGTTETLKLKGGNTQALHDAGSLTVSYKFIFTNHSEDSSPALEVTRFPVSRGNKVTMYQDAHQLANHPSFDAKHHGQPRSCWDDLSTSIEAAKDFILMVGWSVNHETRLRRNSPETVGEQLIRKANTGVAVYVMAWADMSSDMMFGGGMMGTSDVKSMKYFKGTSVNFTRVSRDIAIMTGQLIGGFMGQSLYTHHQKVVALDDGRNNIKAFIGGIDITDGRYDTANHELFDTINTTHQDDFYNGCLVAATKESGPREPWHDIHALVEGPVALDLVQNFVERALKQAPEWSDQLRLTLQLSTAFGNAEKSRGTGKMDAQILRSIDYGVVQYDRSSKYSKLFSNNEVIENSIQFAYMKNIARAKNFIYIENQYFLGSSVMWRDVEHNDVKCNHHVPRALVGKINEKIDKREPFKAYIVIPLFPEGDPHSAPSQEIIHWQWQTIGAMYHQIANKLRSCGVKAKPTDYLQFFFLGTRDACSDTSKFTSSADANVTNAVKNKRHMIYVHSKLMIVDDDYVLIGSANINERSMGGTRDSEIAIHAWEPSNMTKGTHYANGDVHNFRNNLWREHLGGYHSFFDKPHTDECSQNVRKMAQDNWHRYSAPVNTELKHGHLCTYPIDVLDNGDIATLPGFEFFPDSTAKITGQTTPNTPMMMVTT